jgi:hypothetical protein
MPVIKQTPVGRREEYFAEEIEQLRSEHGDMNEANVRYEKEIERLQAAFNNIQVIVDAQAEDDGLWFDPVTAPEGYLQQALRALTAAIEFYTKPTNPPVPQSKSQERRFAVQSGKDSPPEYVDPLTGSLLNEVHDAVTGKRARPVARSKSQERRFAHQIPGYETGKDNKATDPKLDPAGEYARRERSGREPGKDTQGEIRQCSDCDTWILAGQACPFCAQRTQMENVSECPHGMSQDRGEECSKCDNYG